MIFLKAKVSRHFTSQAYTIASSRKRVWNSSHERGGFIDGYFSQTLTRAKKMKVNSENKGDVAIVEKI